jgi:hypothetical protein
MERGAPKRASCTNSALGAHVRPTSDILHPPSTILHPTLRCTQRGGSEAAGRVPYCRVLSMSLPRHLTVALTSTPCLTVPVPGTLGGERTTATGTSIGPATILVRDVQYAQPDFHTAATLHIGFAWRQKDVKLAITFVGGRTAHSLAHRSARTPTAFSRAFSALFSLTRAPFGVEPHAACTHSHCVQCPLLTGGSCIARLHVCVRRRWAGRSTAHVHTPCSRASIARTAPSYGTPPKT